MAEFPRYRDLPIADQLDARHAWGVFGDGDEFGRVNLLTGRARCRRLPRGEARGGLQPLSTPDIARGRHLRVEVLESVVLRISVDREDLVPEL